MAENPYFYRRSKLVKNNFRMKPIKLFSILLAVLGWNLSLYAQCDTTAIDQSQCIIEFADMEPNSGQLAANVLDGDETTFWNTTGSVAFPHHLIIDLGDTLAVNGLSVKPRVGSNAGRLEGYEIYLSNNSTVFPNNPEAAGELSYNGYWQETPEHIYFGAKEARYLYLFATSNFDQNNNNRLQISEIIVYEDQGCGDQGKTNQVISFEAIEKQSTVSDPIELVATSNYGTDISYEIVEGADVVELNGNVISFTGTAGQVILKAYNEGDTEYYPASTEIKFQVVDLSIIYPTISTRLTDAVPLEKMADGVYPIYIKSSIAEASFLDIASVSVSVDGQDIDVFEQDNHYVGLWTLDGTGVFNVVIEAEGSNGNITAWDKSIEVVDNASSQLVQAMDAVLVNFPNPGRTITIDTVLPQFLGAYNKVTAYLDVNCPNINGGCDDWDRKGYFEIQRPDGQWVEFIRYITPYGVGCDHVADVTDFMDLLQGEVKLRVFIDTWGTGGWEFNLSLEYEQGEPDFLYRSLTKVWDKNNAPFGNLANLQPMETVEITLSDYVESSKLRLVTTGHGWGANNTGNAAEFYHAVHNIAVDGANTFEQDLWNTCDPNPDGCTGQQGTWWYNRAGWCPGTIAPPFEYILDDAIAGNTFTLDYIFQTSYIDYCSSNNPDCVSGVTCPDCSDSYNPHYYVDGFLIKYSDTYINEASNIMQDILPASEFLLSPNPVHDILTLSTTSTAGYARFLIIDVHGKIIQSREVDAMALYGGRVEMPVYDLEAGTYFVRIFTKEGSQTKKFIKH